MLTGTEWKSIEKSKLVSDEKQGLFEVAFAELWRNAQRRRSAYIGSWIAQIFRQSSRRTKSCVPYMETLMHKTVGVAIGIAALAAPILAIMAGVDVNNERRVLEATVWMERLATDLEHAKKIAPETKLEIARLTTRPWYDCNQLACRKALEIRNRAAREHLQTILAGSETPIKLGASRLPSGVPSSATSHSVH